MLERAITTTNKKYWLWILCLLGIIGVGFVCYIWQLQDGLGATTGLSRDASWGLYIGQFTFLVGVAASAVMLVIPYYLHDFKKFGKIVILGEFLAIASVLMCMLFIVVDMGQPNRVMNVMLHPTLNSVMFYDMLVLLGYLIINLVVGWKTLTADKLGIAPPPWVKILIYLSVPWAVSIHTVTAFLYAGIPGKHFWLTAIMAARFLSSAFAGGPALLIILALIVRQVSRFDPGKDVIQAVAKIVTYAMAANVFFIGLEVFTAFYSGIHGHVTAFYYLYHDANIAPIMVLSLVLMVGSLAMLIFPSVRKKEGLLGIACVILFISLWIDKGFGLVIGGFLPNSFEKVDYHYAPQIPEVLITLMVWGIGLLVLTLLYKIVISVREEQQGKNLAQD